MSSTDKKYLRSKGGPRLKKAEETHSTFRHVKVWIGGLLLDSFNFWWLFSIFLLGRGWRFSGAGPSSEQSSLLNCRFLYSGYHVLRFRLNIWFDDEHHPVQWFLTRCREFTALLLAKVSVFLRTADLVLAFMHRIQLFSRIADPADSTW